MTKLARSDDVDRIELGAELRAERERRGLNQKEVGMLLNCERSLVSGAERGIIRGYTATGFARLQNGLLSRLQRVTTEKQAEALKGKPPGLSRTKDRNVEIQRLADEGIPLVDIGKKFNISKQRVDQIIKIFDHKERICPYCNTPFMPKRRDQMYDKKVCIAGHRLGYTPHHLWKQKRFAEITALIAPPDANGCWNWLGNISNVSRYGRTTWNGKSISIHRWMWQQVIGPIPDGLWVLHKCDNSRCCCPSHLFLGTATDNAKDRDAKGRHPGPRGFTPEEVKAIRARYKSTSDSAWLAEQYHVTPTTIYFLAKGRTYAKV